MEELKTLKDLEKDRLFNSDNPEFAGYIQAILDSRQEAIKWLKDRINKCIKCSCLGDWSQLIACEEHKFWMERFNITAEDLK